MIITDINMQNNNLHVGTGSRAACQVPAQHMAECLCSQRSRQRNDATRYARAHALSHNHIHTHSLTLISHSGWNLGKVPGDTSTVFCVDCNENVRASRGTGTKKGHTTSHPTHVLTLMDSIKPGSPRHHLSRVAKTPVPVTTKVKTAYGQTAKQCCKEFGWGKLSVLAISQDPEKHAVVQSRM